MKEITQLLRAFRHGEIDAGGELLRLVYEELRRIAAAQTARETGHTLQPTALVHEAWLRLVDADGKAYFESRAH